MKLYSSHWIYTATSVALGLTGILSCQQAGTQSSNSSRTEVGARGPAVGESSKAPDAAIARDDTRRVEPSLPAPTVASEPTAVEAPPKRPTDLADAWLESLGRRDIESLTRQTRLPFTVHDLEVAKSCASSRANSSEELAKLVSCMGENTLLIADLSAGEGRSPIEEKHVDKGFPRWARRWRKEVVSGLTPTGVIVYGNGVSHDVVMLIGLDGVHALWRNPTYDPN